MLNKKPKVNNCNDPDCLIQKTKNGGNCKLNEIVYSILCQECKDRYVGETSRNGHSRSIEHIKNSKSENTKQREKSVLLRHREEKHEGKEVSFEMKILSTHQHDALGRQCGEAVWIKETHPNKRINNKEEYHQPGDVEIVYNKNDHELKTKSKLKTKENEKIENDKKDDETEQGKSTESFIRSVRNENEIPNDEEIVNTQELINDARQRRIRKMNGKIQTINCDICDFKTGSQTLLNKHKENNHNEQKEKNSQEMRKRQKCDKCDFMTTSINVLKSHEKTNHESKAPPKASKRKSCNVCTKRFNKESTYIAHMNKNHKEGQLNLNLNQIQENVLMKENEVQSRENLNKSNCNTL